MSIKKEHHFQISGHDVLSTLVCGVS